MLYPVRNSSRDLLELSSLWKFKTDPEGVGRNQKWYDDFESGMEIAVPGSWNEQLEESGLLDYVGTAWYSKRVFVPSHFEGKRVWLRVGSADFSCEIWVNGRPAGSGSFGFLPVDVEITKLVKYGDENLVIIAVSNELDGDSIPQGITSEDYASENRLREETNPPARFDFFPFGGIHRPVVIYTTPQCFLKNLKIETGIERPSRGRIELSAEIDGSGGAVSAEVFDSEGKLVARSVPRSGSSSSLLFIDNCRFWSDIDPYLYSLKVRLVSDTGAEDEYSVEVGVREVRIRDGRLFLNGREIFLRGFGKHEDFSVVGRGLFLPLVVKDYALMKWSNANSFRTSHYPYAEEVLAYADRKGMLVIVEAPAISLHLRYATPSAVRNHKEFIRSMVARDRNHPSVIMWSLGNEPNIVGDESYYDGSGRAYWKEVFEYTRGLDSSRPITVPNCTRAGVNDPVFEFCDIISINRYYGWYEYPGDVKAAVGKLTADMDELNARYKKPILVTEFGADSVAGTHSISLQMFTEEYQAKLIEEYVKCIESKRYTVGEMVWNFADFRTPQHFRRVVLNLKGVFTRNREPKAAAFKLKDLWANER